jgi:hypothetical protein
VFGLEVVNVFKPATKLSAMLPSAERTSAIVAMPCAPPFSGRRGPVHLVFPAKLLQSSTWEAVGVELGRLPGGGQAHEQAGQHHVGTSAQRCGDQHAAQHVPVRNRPVVNRPGGAWTAKARLTTSGRGSISDGAAAGSGCRRSGVLEGTAYHDPSAAEE